MDVNGGVFLLRNLPAIALLIGRAFFMLFLSWI